MVMAVSQETRQYVMKILQFTLTGFVRNYTASSCKLLIELHRTQKRIRLQHLGWAEMS
jgi:hypothetical protein